MLREEFGQRPTAREAKSTPAILAKLHRERTPLSTMQDIAGCRVIVADRQAQRQLMADLRVRFPEHKFFDRIAQPSHGYRTLHLVVRVTGHRVEIQVRTELQHLWAQVCELIADRVGLEFKYGQGPTELRQWMDDVSCAVDLAETGPAYLAQTVKMSPFGPEGCFRREGLADFLRQLVLALPVLPGDSQ